MLKIAPSILTADFSNLRAELHSINNADFIHLDVMDGHFVPNITFGPNVVRDIRKHSEVPFDVHLMIEYPERYISDFAKAGADIITFHVEATNDVLKVIDLIKEHNCKVGISIKPKTSVAAIKEYLSLVDLVLVMSVEPGFGGQKFMPLSLEKINELSTLRSELGLNYLIEVDGGINDETAKLCRVKGVDIVVAGSYIFNDSDRLNNIEKLRNIW